MEIRRSGFGKRRWRNDYGWDREVFEDAQTNAYVIRWDDGAQQTKARIAYIPSQHLADSIALGETKKELKIHACSERIKRGERDDLKA